MAAKPNRKSTRQAPISNHPAFPAMVALWFAALFGIGSLILPGVLFDKAAGLVGLDAVGMAGRIGIALCAAALGAVLGVFLARKVAAAHAPVPTRTRRMAPTESDVKKPISALEELGPEGLDQPLDEDEPDIEPDRPEAPPAEPIPGRRRALSVTDESGPSEFLDHAPLPGDEDGDEDRDDDAGEAVAHATEAMAAADEHNEETDEMLELGEFEEGREPREEPATRRTSFGSGSLSASLDGALSGRDRPDIARRSDGGEADARPFDAPEQQPEAETHEAEESAPFAPAPFVPPAEHGAAAPRPFDPVEEHEGAEEAFAAEEPDADTPSPFAELRREFDAPPQPEATRQEFEPEAPQQTFETEAAPPSPEPEATGDSFEPNPDERPFEPQEPQAAPQAFEPAAPAAEGQPTLQRRPAFGMPEPVRDEDIPPAPAAAPEFRASEPQPEPESEPAAKGVAAAALADLGMVELVERFALSLQGHTAPPAAAAAQPLPGPARNEAAPEPEPPALPETQPLPEPEPEPAQASAPAAPSVPAALQPIGYGEDEEEDLDDIPSLSLPLDRASAPFGKPAEAPAQPENAPQALDDDASDAGDDGEGPSDGQRFGSLLAMKSPFGGGREFVRVEDEDDGEAEDGDVEPVVVFPGTEARRSAFPASDGPSRDPAGATPFARQPSRIDRGGTEQALREALAKLQKMSGAA